MTPRILASLFLYSSVTFCWTGATAAHAEDWDALVKDTTEQMANDGKPAAAAPAADTRLAPAVKELEGAIAYIEASPKDFAGQKARLLDDSRRALASLRAAMTAGAAKK